jgi:uncharacterized protein YbbK (DUF523 family)
MIKIGVSACLLGQKVRYDGNHKYTDLQRYFTPDRFQLMAICPEVEMGLPIPRPPIQIINHTHIKLVQADKHKIDFSQQMQQWFTDNKSRFLEYSGYILKSKSPSCGNKTTPHYHKGEITKLSDGMFVHFFKLLNPNLAFIDELELGDDILREQFKNRLKRYILN